MFLTLKEVEGLLDERGKENEKRRSYYFDRCRYRFVRNFDSHVNY